MYILISESPFEDKSEYSGLHKTLDKAKQACEDYWDEDETWFIDWTEEVGEDGRKELHGRTFWDAKDPGDINRDWHRIIFAEAE